MRAIIAAGGSGGHIFPAVATARRLSDISKDVEILFVGSNKALDRSIFEREHFKHSLLTANKLPYKKGLALIPFAFKLLFDLIHSAFIIIMFKPDVVAGFGGYVSWPVVFVAKSIGIPTIVHEQNVVPGRANKVLFKYADRVAVSFAATKSSVAPATKAVLTGNPVRASVSRVDRSAAIKALGLEDGKFTILIVGGSQGSHSLNEAVISDIADMDDAITGSLQVVHITGARDYEWASKRYGSLSISSRTFSFVDDIENAYSAADLIITRSGSSSVFECALFAKPMILVPYPFAMSHQLDNAKVFSGKGAAVLIEEKDLRPGRIREEISRLFNGRDALIAMSKASSAMGIPDAANRLADEMISLVAG